MKIEICEKKPESKKPLRVRLVQGMNGQDIVLIACDEYGNKLSGGNLLVLREDGCVERCQAICFDGSNQLQLDEHKRIKIR